MSQGIKQPDGLHVHRLGPKCGNPREVAFAEQWQSEHAYSDLLGQLFLVPATEGTQGAERDWVLGASYCKPLGYPTERDRIVAATVVQWLGSNIGMGYLREALGKCGYKIELQATK